MYAGVIMLDDVTLLNIAHHAKRQAYFALHVHDVFIMPVVSTAIR